jgi:hypothetical protein
MDEVFLAKKRAARSKPRSTKGSSTRTSSARVKQPPSVAARIPASTRKQTKAAAKKFATGTVARGEAVPAGKPLPPGATHEIVGYHSDGTPILKRKRISTY